MTTLQGAHHVEHADHHHQEQQQQQQQLEGYGSIPLDARRPSSIVVERQGANNTNMLRTKRVGLMTLLMLAVLAARTTMTKNHQQKGEDDVSITTRIGSTSRGSLLPEKLSSTLVVSEISLLSTAGDGDDIEERSSQQQINHDPTEPLYFQQIVNHNNNNNDDDDDSGTIFFSQRYYVNFNYWKGPGHPIFLIFGGEGPLERILYPSVSEVLAERFGAVTFNVEHRYFGESYPMQNYSMQDIAEQLTPRQALQDIVFFMQQQQKQLGCGPRGSPTYCPVLTVGGSYAGLLSTLIRLSYPDVVDMAYAASPCLLLFSHQTSPYVYYEYVTEVAERISHGCPDAVQNALHEIQSDLDPITSRTQLQTMARDYGICSDLPDDIQTGSDLASELISYTAGQFISTNMDYYPPRPDQKFFQGCSIFQEPHKSAAERMRHYIAMIRRTDDKNKEKDDDDSCYAVGPSEEDADLWDALCCYLVPMIGKSNDTMWPADTYQLEKNIEDCHTNFGIQADPKYLEHEFGWKNGDLTGVTRLVLTNGYNDGWFPLSYTEEPIGDDLDDVGGVTILNMENGAHHSDLTHQLQADTPDVERVHSEIAQLISEWLDEIRHEDNNQ